MFSPDAFRGLFSVPATGGTPTPLTKVGPEESHRLPHFLPGRRRLLYLSSGGTTGGHGLRVLDLDTGADTPLMDDASGALYARPGWLCFVRDGNLMAQAFDADTLTLSGEPRLLAESVAYAVFRHTGPYDASQSGVLVYCTSASRRTRACAGSRPTAARATGWANPRTTRASRSHPTAAARWWRCSPTTACSTCR